MATVTLRNLGGSVVMVVPKKILSLVDLKAGSQVRIAVENGRVVIEPRMKPHYTLAELLAKSPRKALKPSRDDREWLSGGPVGKEAI
jgi:antitoxin ChpS